MTSESRLCPESIRKYINGMNKIDHIWAGEKKMLGKVEMIELIGLAKILKLVGNTSLLTSIRNK